MLDEDIPCVGLHGVSVWGLNPWILTKAQIPVIQQTNKPSIEGKLSSNEHPPWMYDCTYTSRVHAQKEK